MKKIKDEADKIQDLESILERITLELNQERDRNESLSRTIEQLDRENEGLRANQEVLNNIEEDVKRIE